LGAVTLVASGLIAPDRLFLYLGICSGLLIAGMGTALFVSRARGLLRRHREPGTHRHGLFGRAHSHGAAHGHNHDMASDDAHDAHGHAPSAVSWRSLVTLGVAGGLIPCPSALVVMLAAISLGQVLFGMLLIVAFSAGLAGVLVAIGVALVLGRRLPGRSRARTAVQRAGLARALPAVPVLSAFAVTLAGIAITYQAWNQPGL
jgi:ABC-type nickel/cobalt efflux system permease component RcnA